MKFALCTLLFSFLIGCGTAAVKNQSSEKPASITSSENVNVSKVATDPKETLEDQLANLQRLKVPRILNFIELYMNEERMWKSYDYKRVKDVIYLPPGNYRYKASTKSMVGYSEGLFTISAGDDQNFLHTTTAPNLKHVFFWYSNVSREQVAKFRSEQLLMYCRSAENVIEHYPNESEYVLDACNKLAQQGSGEALLILGRLHREGVGVDEDVSKAKMYYQQSHEKGYPFGGLGLGYLLMDEGETAEAIRVVKEVAEKGESFAMYLLASFYTNEGSSTSASDVKKAKYWAEKAANLGEDAAIRLLAYLVLLEDKINPDFESSVVWHLVNYRVSNERSWQIDDAFLNNENELSETQKARARVTAKKFVESINPEKTATLCVGNLYKDNDEKSKSISLKINKSEESISAPRDRHIQIKQLLPKNENRITVYFNGEIENYKTLNFQEEYAQELCLYYDTEIEILVIESKDYKKHCNCN